MKLFTVGCVAALMILGATSNARAEDKNAVDTSITLAQYAANTNDQNRGGAPRRWLSELRLGVLTQDRGPIVDDVESGVAVNFEALFNSPRAFASIGAPRPHIGISAASDADATSYVYTGLTWEHDFLQHWFLVGGFGLAVHNGEYLSKADQPADEWDDQKTLGCRVVFHWGIGAGRRLSRRWNAAIHYEHVSSGGVCGDGGEGIENVGLRIGRVF